jgi:hypothetical protein
VVLASTATYTLTVPPSPTISPTYSASPSPLPLPERFRLVTVFPNPIPGKGGYFVVSLPKAAVVQFKIMDLRGELIWEDVERYTVGGSYQLFWPAQNNSGTSVSYGAYYLVAKAKFAEGDDTQGRWISVVR